MAQPGDAYPVPHSELITGVSAYLDDLSHHLVAGSHPFAVHGKIALGDVQVGAAHPARVHGHQQLGRIGPRHLRGDLL
jgi:hypothetical protein